MSEFEAWKSRASRAWGDKFDPSEVLAVDPRIRAHLHKGRVEITRTYPDGETWVRRGRVGVTTGWRPALMLLARVDSSGSSDLLGPDDRLTRVIRER